MSFNCKFKQILGIQALVCATIWSGNVFPAQAQSANNLWNYAPYALQGLLPYTGGWARGSNLPFGFRNMMYMPYNYHPNTSMAQPSSPQQVGSPNQSGQTSQNNNSTYQQQYTDPEPLLGPRARNRQARANANAQDQIAYAKWLQPQGPIGNQKLGSNPPGSAFSGPHPIGSSQPMQNAPQFAYPPVAPNPQSRGSSGFGETGSSAENKRLTSNFISTVNGKFHGDIKKALFDAKTRGMASELHLVDEDSMFDTDFSASKVDIVRKIMRDPSLDPANKLDAMRAILHR
jgi:hypothetical protein